MSKQIAPEVMAELVARLEREPQDVAEMATWLPLAARAAAFRERRFVDELAPAHFARLGIDSSEAMHFFVLGAVKEGAYDLENAMCEFQGCALIDCQDWGILPRLAPRPEWLTGNLVEMLEGYRACGDPVVLDDDAAEMVEVYKDRYPMRPRFLLVSVKAPLTKGIMKLARSMVQALREHEDKT